MIYVGTSGWQYDDWRGRFYPKELSKNAWLGYFSARFPTVEVNNTFYRMPQDSAFERWRDGTPDDFVVTIKASRFITHIKRLREGKESLELLWSRCRLLGPKLGPVLFQLPPKFRADHDRLREFCSLLPKEMRPAFEFRDASWETPETYDILETVGAAFVLADWPNYTAPDVVTGGWSYIRLHKGGPHRPSYSRSKLERWGARIVAMKARDVYVYFNNDPGGAALRDACTLTNELLEQRADVVGPSDVRPRRKAS